MNTEVGRKLTGWLGGTLTDEWMDEWIEGNTILRVNRWRDGDIGR